MPTTWMSIAGLACVLVVLHLYTRGRSSPLAAFAFMLAGPVLGVLLFVPVAMKNRATSPGAGSKGWGLVYGLSLQDYCARIAIVGLGAAVVVAIVFALVIARDLRYSRIRSRPFAGRAAAPRALAALGLGTFATLDDVERAYREQAKQAHPDRGGDAVEFKRLQENYERAKRAVRGRR